MHNFYEVDYLPENDRIRYTIHPDARKEVLKRLLLLNHERYEEEIKQGLHKKADVEAFYQQKGIEVPMGTVFSDKKAAEDKKDEQVQEKMQAKLKTKETALKKEKAIEQGLFGNKKIEEGDLVTVLDLHGNKEKILLSNDIPSTEEYKSENFMSVWYNTLLGRTLNERIKYLGKEYDINEIRKF